MKNPVIKLLFIALASCLTFANLLAQSSAPAINTLSEKEKAEGWKLLFDGQTTAGWRNFNSNKIGPAWKVSDGTLSLDASKKDNWQSGGGGDIITEGEYENFDFMVEWKIEACGNCGIIFDVKEDPQYKYVWNTGLEMQVLDNTCHPDAKIIKHRAGDLYDLISCSRETVKPADEWNQARILCNHGNCELWLNGENVVKFRMHTPEWDTLVKNSKFKDMPDFGKATRGHISLQDHGNQVWFRNIKIKELN